MKFILSRLSVLIFYALISMAALAGKDAPGLTPEAKQQIKQAMIDYIDSHKSETGYLRIYDVLSRKPRRLKFEGLHNAVSAYEGGVPGLRRL